MHLLISSSELQHRILKSKNGQVALIQIFIEISLFLVSCIVSCVSYYLLLILTCSVVQKWQKFFATQLLRAIFLFIDT